MKNNSCTSPTPVSAISDDVTVFYGDLYAMQFRQLRVRKNIRRLIHNLADSTLKLTERNAFISKYLAEGEEALMYSSAEEVNRIFSQNLSSERIALAGMKRIIDGGNSFEDRVVVLIKALEVECQMPSTVKCISAVPTCH